MKKELVQNCPISRLPFLSKKRLTFTRVKFEFSDTKTRDSRRIVPITKVLLNELKMLYEQDKKTIMDLMIISLLYLMLNL